MSADHDRAARRAAYLIARAEAARTLEAGDLDEVVQLLDSPWRGVRVMAVQALRVGQRRDALPQLIEHTGTEEDGSVRRAIALALRDVPDSRSRETLWKFLDDDSDDVRLPALKGLSRLGDERVVPVAVSWYQSGGLALRAGAIDALATIQTEAAENALQGLLDTEPRWRRRRFIRKMIRSARRHDGGK